MAKADKFDAVVREKTRKGDKWMQGAVKHPGALTRQAKSAGMSTMEFAREHKGSKGTTGKRARLALTFNKYRRKK